MIQHAGRARRYRAAAKCLMGASTIRPLALALLLQGVSGAGALPLKVEEELFSQAALTTPRAATSVLLSVASAGRRFVAVGESGYIVLSDDDGRTWRQVEVPVAVALTKVFFASAQNGWAVGHSGVVLHTRDGGETWTKQLDGLQIVQLEVAAAASASSGAASMAEIGRLTADGPDKPLFDVYFDETGRGLVVGAYGLAFTSIDGGLSWSTLRGIIPNPKGKHLYAVGASGLDIFVVGEQGAMFKLSTTDMRCAELVSPYVGTYFGIVKDNHGGFIAYGLRGNAYRTTDRGGRWTKLEVDQTVTLTSATKLKSGLIVMTDETGRVFRVDESTNSLRPASVERPMSITGVVEGSDGALIVTGSKGVAKLTLDKKQ